MSNSNPALPYQPYLNWHVLAAFALTAPVRINCSIEALTVVATNYNRNIERVKSMILVPSTIALFARHYQRCYDSAEYLADNTLNGVGRLTGHPNHKELSDHAMELYRQIEAQRAEARAGADWLKTAIAEIDLGTSTVHGVTAPGNPTTTGLEAMLSSCVLGCWTAFETMAGDLWEASLNVHPRGLAELKGKRKRMLTKTDDADNDSPSGSTDDNLDTENPQTVPLAQILRHSFDIRDRMGSVLRGKFRFDHLAGIREAYGLAFHKNFSAIQTEMQNEALDALNAVRNLIVHRNGVVDATYEKKARFLKIPKADLGQTIALDGKDAVYQLLAPSVVCSMNLLQATQNWISAN